MWQKKENTNRESISMEEYLVKRKRKREKDDADRVNPLYLEGGQLILAELYMQVYIIKTGSLEPVFIVADCHPRHHNPGLLILGKLTCKHI